MNTTSAPTSERLTDAAIRLFYEKGYAETSMQDVADEISILKGSLYHYTASKEDLLYQIILNVRTGSLALIDEAAAQTDRRAIDRLASYVSKNVRYHGEQYMTGAILHREIGSLNPERQNELNAQKAIYENFVASLIDEAKSDGDIADQFDSRTLTRFVFSVINSVFDWYKPNGPIGPTELGEIYATLAIHGLSGEGPVPGATTT